MKYKILMSTFSLMIIAGTDSSTDENYKKIMNLVSNVEKHCGIPSHKPSYWLYGQEAYAPCRKNLKDLESEAAIFKHLSKTQKHSIKEKVSRLHVRVKNNLAGTKRENLNAFKTPIIHASSFAADIGIASSLLYGLVHDDDGFILTLPALILMFSAMVEGMGDVNKAELSDVDQALESFIDIIDQIAEEK